MNDDFPFTSIGDEPVEARIVAWVLGEASAFEAAELERLCGERPELLVFRRRMLALHGLLAEAHATSADEDWKLPSAKRQALDDILGAPPPGQPDSLIEKRIRHNGRRAWLAIAACVMVTLIIGGLYTLKLGGRADFQRLAMKDAPATGPDDAARTLLQLNRAVRDQEDKVEDRRKLLATIPKPVADSSPLENGKNELQVAPTGTMSLKTKLPPELIEGTPRPIVLHGMSSERLPLPTGASSMPYAGGSRADAKDHLAKQAAEAASAPDGKKSLDMLETAAPAAAAPRPEEALANRAAALPKPSVATPEPTSGLAVDAETAPAAKVPGNAPTDHDGRLARPRVVGGMSGGMGGGGATGDRDSGSRPLPRLRGMIEDRRELAENSKAAEAQIPVLGALFARPDKNGANERRAANKELGQDRGKTAVVAGTSSITGSNAYAADKPEGAASDGSVSVRKAEQAGKGDEGSRNRHLAGGKDRDEKSGQAGATSGGQVQAPQLEIIREFTYPTEYEPPPVNGPSAAADPLHKAIQDQEKKVEDRRKVLANIARTKGAILKGSNQATGEATRESAIKRGLDAQDYGDAARDLEADQEMLQQLKLKQKLVDEDAPLDGQQTKARLPDLMEEVAAAQDPYSTFSLNISDASFQVAQAALAKGERPDPAGIKVEQFYNAVDYGDPAPSAGEPVAVAIEQAAHPVIPGRNLVRVALKTAAEGRGAKQPLRLTLLVDQSGSMVRDDRRAAMDQALAGLAGLLTPDDLVTVIGFARTPRLLADGWTGAKAAQLTELVNQSASEGGTNLEEALKLAEQLAARRKLAGAQNRIVLFTDGAANLGDADPARLAAKVKTLRQQGISFDIAGIVADGLNDELLGELARNGNGRYYVVGKGADENFARQLAGAFRPAAENVKVQVHFNPERVGRYKLIGFEKDRLKTEDFRNDAVDAAELAAEEAGVAIYQVEPLAGGSGELGDVSVRFRDAATGQMVERTWTIPHDAGAPAIDRATPSMQLAVLAMCAAEKLRGGPLADAIDFKQFAAPRANVKRFYGNNARVVGVLDMLNSL